METVRIAQLKERPTITELYFDISGSDTTGNGTTDFPFFSIQKTVDYIKANYTPSVTLQFTAKALTAYNLIEALDLSNSDWININAWDCNFRINDMIIGGNNIVTIGQLKRASGVGSVVRKEGTGTSYLNVKKLHNGVSSGLIFIDDGILEITAKNEILAKSRTDTLITQNPAASGSKCIMRANTIKGKIVTALIDTEVAVYADFLDTDPDINAGANSILSGIVNRWKGNPSAIGALGNIKLIAVDRESNPASDSYDSTAVYRIQESHTPNIHSYISSNGIITDGSWNTITYGSNLGTPYGVSKSGTEFTIEINGIFNMIASVEIEQDGSGGTRDLRFQIDRGTGYEPEERDNEREADASGVTPATQVVRAPAFNKHFKKGDKIKVEAYQDSGGDLTLYGGADYIYNSAFKIEKIGNF